MCAQGDTKHLSTINSTVTLKKVCTAVEGLHRTQGLVKTPPPLHLPPYIYVHVYKVQFFVWTFFLDRIAQKQSGNGTMI